MPRRSVLYTPGDSPKMLRSAVRAGADVNVFDLEDGVRPADRPDARETLRTVVPEIATDVPGELWIRVGGRADRRRTDVREAVAPLAEHVDGVVLPKVTAADDVAALRDQLREHGAGVPVHALIERARGVLAADAVADAAGVGSLAIGAEDLAGEMGLTRTTDNEEVLYARQRVATAAAAAGVDAIDIIHADVGDEAGLATEATQACRYGFDGKMCIHPAQVPVVERAFTPPEDEVEWAQRVVAAASERDTAVFELEGDLVEPPIVDQARRLLNRAGVSVENEQERGEHRE